jgi:hypothetical protein
MAGITSGGGAAARCGDTFPLGSMAEASTRAGECSSSPWWPRALVQALVKCGGAARRWGGRRRRRRRNGVEVEEAWEAGALDDGGPGSSHGRLRSSRRTALPQAAPIPPSPPSLLLLLRRVGGRTGEWVPLRRLGLGDPRVSAAALIEAGGAGARGRPGCAGERGARRDSEATAGARRFSFGRHQKWQRRGNDKGDVSATPA